MCFGAPSAVGARACSGLDHGSGVLGVLRLLHRHHSNGRSPRLRPPGRRSRLRWPFCIRHSNLQGQVPRPTTLAPSNPWPPATYRPSNPQPTNPPLARICVPCHFRMPVPLPSASIPVHFRPSVSISVHLWFLLYPSVPIHQCPSVVLSPPVHQRPSVVPPPPILTHL